MKDGWGWGAGAVVLFVVYLWYEQRRKARDSGFAFVRVVAPGSNVFRNIVVLAVVVGLAWYVYWVTSTHCGGGC